MWQWGKPRPRLQPQILSLVPSAQSGEPSLSPIFERFRALWKEVNTPSYKEF